MRWGVAVAGVYIAWVTVLYVLSRGSAFEAKDRSFPAIVLAYLFGGVLGGAIVGVLLPLVRYKIGAAFVGMIAFVPVGLGFRIVLVGFTPWQHDDTLMISTLAVLLGGFAGLVLYGVMDPNE
jgi:hypothetical protein